MLPVIILPQADEDSDLFYLYIARDNLQIANSFLEKTEETYSLIANFPRLAPIFSTENPKLIGLRWFPIKDFPNHLVFYIEDETHITVIRVLHRSQDIIALLD